MIAMNPVLMCCDKCLHDGAEYKYCFNPACQCHQTVASSGSKGGMVEKNELEVCVCGHCNANHRPEGCDVGGCGCDFFVAENNFFKDIRHKVEKVIGLSEKNGTRWNDKDMHLEYINGHDAGFKAGIAYAIEVAMGMREIVPTIQGGTQFSEGRYNTAILEFTERLKK